MEKKIHKSYIDILRLIAVFLVYYTHTATRSAYHYQIEGGPVSYHVAFVMHVLMLSGPSVFFIISGGLLLSKNESIKDLCLKRVLKFVLIILFFNLFQLYYKAVFDPIMLENPFTDNLKMIYGYTLITQYWFLNSYLVFILLLPILRPAAQKMSDEAFLFVFSGFAIVELILPILEYFLDMQRIALDFGPLAHIVVSPLIGYFIEYRINNREINKKTILILNVISITLLSLNTWYMHATYDKTGSETYLLGAAVLVAAIIYADIKVLFEKIKLSANAVKLLKILGDGVFFAYLIEIQMKDLYVALYDKTVNYISWFGATVLWLVPGIITAILIRYLLSLIPGLKKIIP